MGKLTDNVLPWGRSLDLCKVLPPRGKITFSKGEMVLPLCKDNRSPINISITIDLGNIQVG